MNIFKSKLLILLILLVGLALPASSQAQLYYYGNPFHMSTSNQVAYGINNFFGALNDGLNMMEQNRAIEQNMAIRRNNLETYRSLRRLQEEGPLPFAPVAPDGKPRSPQITWDDVQSIR